MTAPAYSAPVVSVAAATATATLGVSAATLNATYGLVALVRRSGSADPSVDTPEGWELIGSAVSGTSSRVMVNAYGKRGNGSTNSITITGANSMATQVYLFAWANIKSNTFWTTVDLDQSNVNRTTISGGLTATAAEDDSTAVAFVAVGGSAGGSGFTWTNDWAQQGGGTSGSSNSWARLDGVGNAVASTTTPSWTTSGLAAGLAFTLNTAVVNSPPEITVSPTQNVTAGSTVSLTAEASDPDGTVASYAWSFDYPTSGAPTISGATTASASFTAGSAPQLYVVRCTVTDNSGDSSFATTEVRVPASGGAAARPLPQNGTAVGTWTNVGGAATRGAALADESDSTYVQSDDLSSTETRLRVRVAPSGNRSSSTVSWRLATDAGTATVKVRLFEGNVQRQEWTQAITASPTAYNFSVTSPGTITDWGNLYLEIAGSI